MKNKKTKQKKYMMISVSLVAIALVLLLGIGGKKYMSNKKTNTNLENQRKAALALAKEEPHISKIVFTSEGISRGIGMPWSVGADVTMDGEVFFMSVKVNGSHIINLGIDENNYKSDKLDEIKNKKTVKQTVKVIYSNGKSEEIR